MSQEIDIIEERLNQLENPQDRNNFHHYVRPLADRLGELEKVVEEKKPKEFIDEILSSKETEEKVEE